MKAGDAATAAAMTATQTHSSSNNGLPQMREDDYHHQQQDAAGHDNGYSTSAGAVQKTPPVASPAERELIARGKMLLERYQQQRQQQHTMEKDSVVIDALSSGSHDLEHLQHQPPPQFYSEISLLSSILSSGSEIIASGSDGMHDHIASSSSSSGFLAGQNGVSKVVDPVATSALKPSHVGSWSEFLVAQGHSAHLLSAMDEQLQRLCEFVKDDFKTESFLLPLCSSIRQLLQQKRAAESAIERFTAAIGPPVFVDHDSELKGGETTSGDEEPVPMLEAWATNSSSIAMTKTKWLSQPQLRELVDEETAELQKELDESKLFIEELKTKVHSLRTDFSQDKTRSHSSPAAIETADENSKQRNHDELHASFAEARKLENRLQEKNELLVSLRTSLEDVVQDHTKLEQALQRSAQAVEQLGAERRQLEKAALDKVTLLKRAYAVKAQQLEQLCRNVELPATWQQLTDENGIVYFQQRDQVGARPQLEDPRVSLALSRHGVTGRKTAAAAAAGAAGGTSSSVSPRSASGRMEHIAWEERKRRAFSLGSQQSRHSSVDLTTCEDISAPPDDGCKHKIDDFATPLPEGWEMRATEAGSVFFVNRYTNATTWNDPREEEEPSDSGGSGAASHRPVEFGSLRVKIPFERKQKDFGSNENTVTPYCPPGFPQDDGVQYFDVVFKERGPIGIHFQANSPDAGATVRRLLPGTAAIETGILRPFDRLIAVNQHPVDSASFRHVMILLQGGLRPLTLSFKRDLNASHRKSASGTAERGGGEQGFDADLDEEVVLDSEMDQPHGDAASSPSYGERRGSSKDLLNRRHSAQGVASQPPATAAATRAAPGSVSASAEHEDESVADKIITNLFSFFWTPPEPVTGEVQTV